MIEKRRPDVLTLFKTFYDLSVSRNIFSKAEMRLFGVSGSEELITYYCNLTRTLAERPLADVGLSRAFLACV